MPIFQNSCSRRLRGGRQAGKGGADSGMKPLVRAPLGYLAALLFCSISEFSSTFFLFSGYTTTSIKVTQKNNSAGTSVEMVYNPFKTSAVCTFAAD